MDQCVMLAERWIPAQIAVQLAASFYEQIAHFLLSYEFVHGQRTLLTFGYTLNKSNIRNIVIFCNTMLQPHKSTARRSTLLHKYKVTIMFYFAQS